MKPKFQLTFKQFRIICLLYPFIIFLLSLLFCFIFHENEIIWEDNLKQEILHTSFRDSVILVSIFTLPTFTLYLNLNKRIRRKPFLVIFTFIPLIILFPYILWFVLMTYFFFVVLLISYLVFYFYILPRVVKD